MSTPPIYAEKKQLTRIELDTRGSVIKVCPDFLSKEQSTSLFNHLLENISWQQTPMVNPRTGESFLLPRMQGWMSEKDKKAKLYQKTAPDLWTDQVLQVKKAIEESLESVCAFDYVLFNRYRDGQDSINFHRDDEAEGVNERDSPRNIIASLSIGATRTFVMKSRHRDKKGSPCKKVEYKLSDGYLIVMEGTTQENWVHGVPKEPEIQGERINLTFRIT